VIGNVHGDLLIFKGITGDGKPWAKATDLGMVTVFFTFYCLNFECQSHLDDLVNN